MLHSFHPSLYPSLHSLNLDQLGQLATQLGQLAAQLALGQLAAQLGQLADHLAKLVSDLAPLSGSQSEPLAQLSHLASQLASDPSPPSTRDTDRDDGSEPARQGW